MPWRPRRHLPYQLSCEHVIDVTKFEAGVFSEVNVSACFSREMSIKADELNFEISYIANVFSYSLIRSQTFSDGLYLTAEVRLKGYS